MKHDNKIKARIRNTGPLQVDDIHVTCYVNSPPGIGDNGEWQTLETRPVASIPGNGEVIVEFNWVPEVDRHTCISVAVLPKLGEVTGKNNRAQENVAVFDSASGSSHEPVILEAQVRNPFTIGKRVDLLVRHLPDRWHAVVDRSHVWLGGKGSAPVRAVIWTDLAVRSASRASPASGSPNRRSRAGRSTAIITARSAASSPRSAPCPA